MNTVNLKTISASLIVLTLNIGSITQAFADSVLYPGSMCSFENRGTVGALDKRLGSVSASTHRGTIVTCPIPHGPPPGDATHNFLDVSVKYRYRSNNQDVPIKCMIQSTRNYNNELNKIDSVIKHGPLEQIQGSVNFERVAVSVLATAVLRCRVPAGAYLGGYRVAGAG